VRLTADWRELAAVVPHRVSSAPARRPGRPRRDGQPLEGGHKPLCQASPDRNPPRSGGGAASDTSSFPHRSARPSTCGGCSSTAAGSSCRYVTVHTAWDYKNHRDPRELWGLFLSETPDVVAMGLIADLGDQGFLPSSSVIPSNAHPRRWAGCPRPLIRYRVNPTAPHLRAEANRAPEPGDGAILRAASAGVSAGLRLGFQEGRGRVSGRQGPHCPRLLARNSRDQAGCPHDEGNARCAARGEWPGRSRWRPRPDAGARVQAASVGQAARRPCPPGPP